MQLRGFKRVSLEPGQKMTVDFTLTPEDLSLIDVNMNRVVEPGMFDLMVGAKLGGNQQRCRSKWLTHSYRHVEIPITL